MTKKLSLELDSLAVESFETAAVRARAAAPGADVGTVRAAEDQAEAAPAYDCTCAYSCVCRTAYYHCGDGYHTLYSCDYTNNGSCKYTDDDVTCFLPCTQ